MAALSVAPLPPGAVLGGESAQPSSNGGVVRWDQANAAHDRLRSEWREDIRGQLEPRDREMRDVKASIQREVIARQLHEQRTDKLEQWRDRWQGPLILAIAALQVVGILVGIYAVFR